MSVSAIGIDLAKNTFSLHGIDEHGKVFLKKILNRNKLMLTLANLPPCMIGMETCSGYHYWARRKKVTDLFSQIFSINKSVTFSL